MTRIGCFRDDVIFIIYLYQRYIYKVDYSRPAEGGGMVGQGIQGGKDDDDKKKK